MRLPLTFWRNTLRALGYKAKRNWISDRHRNPVKSELEFNVEVLEPRQMLSGATSFVTVETLPSDNLPGANGDGQFVAIYEPAFSESEEFEPTKARFTVHRSEFGPDTINLKFDDSSATENIDYVFANSSLNVARTQITFLPNELTASFDVEVLDDSFADHLEEIVVELTPGHYAPIANQKIAEATILEEAIDEAEVSIKAIAPAFEHNTVNGSFRVERDPEHSSITEELEVDLQVIEDLTATDVATIGQDYKLQWDDGQNVIEIDHTDPFTVIIPANESSIELEIVPIDDSLLEEIESVTVNVLPKITYDIVEGEAVEQIYDSEGDRYVVLVSDEEGNEGDTITFDIRLTKPLSTGTVKADWQLVDGSATRDDYTGPFSKYDGTATFCSRRCLGNCRCVFGNRYIQRTRRRVLYRIG